ncbi:hypothetical protein ISN44_As12g032140 [Arabidopsis suecica]|uniref:Uncharacterized protein n=1 Tax=Arabidopsis suecica TaxID=45249 RepID=A0A8T1YPB5_ARASU|nr:hypothetical protein ISN44_As12g032140 [Arabidopsis suecica]
MSSPAVYVSDNEDDSQGIPVPRGDEVFTQTGDKFGPHFRSQSTHASLGALRRLCNIPQETEFSLPGPNESPEMVREGYCCARRRDWRHLPRFLNQGRDIPSSFFGLEAGNPSDAFMETNGMIFHYENLLHQAMKETAKAKKEVDELRLANQSERFEQAKALESSFENMKKTLAANEQRIRIADAERDSARSDALRLESELEEATALFEETNQKTELLIRNRARDIAEAEHNAREEMRGFGRQLIQSIMKFIKDEEVWTKLQSDRAELKSNLDLIGGIESGRISLEDERREVSAELATVESELSSASRPSLDLKPFSLVFGDSPSQFEVGEGSRPYEGSPEIVGRHKALCDKRKRIGRRRRALDERIKKMEREILCVESEPHEWERNGLDIVATIPTCLRRFLRMLDKFFHLSLATGDGFSFISCSSEFRRFPILRTEENEGPEEKSIDPSSGPLDLSSDEGLSSESWKERVKCYDFLEKIVGRHKALCDKRKRIGRRRRALDERIKKMEREILCVESEPHEWERNGLDIVATIPTCLRRFLRMLDKFFHLSLATGDGFSFISCSSEFRRFPILRTEENEGPEEKSIDPSSGPLDLSSDEGLS